MILPLEVPRGFGIEDAAAERAGWLSRWGNPSRWRCNQPTALVEVSLP